MSDEIRRLSDELARDPSSLVFLQLGETLRRHGQLELASRVELRGLERHPHNADAHDLLARICVDQGSLEKAFDEWDMVLRLDPGHVGARKGMGYLLFKQGHLEEAVHHLGAAATSDPHDRTIATALELVREILAERSQQQKGRRQFEAWARANGGEPTPAQGSRIVSQSAAHRVTPLDIAALAPHSGANGSDRKNDERAANGEHATNGTHASNGTHGTNGDANGVSRLVSRDLAPDSARDTARAESPRAPRRSSGADRNGAVRVSTPTPPAMPAVGARLGHAARWLYAELLGESEQTALLLDRSGLVIAGMYVAPDGTDVSQEIGAELSGVRDEAQRTAKHLQIGAWRTVMIETSVATVAMAPAADGTLQVVAAGSSVPLGFVARVLDRCVERTHRWLKGGR
jgi:predicted regulator of Ras-like GTPase activity (Roadblock/LC7/MglB family)